jgi:hypothetical protein
VKAAIFHVVDAHFGADRDQLVQPVTRLLGFASTSAQLRAVVESALAEMVEENRLSVAGTLVSVPRKDALSA